MEPYCKVLLVKCVLHPVKMHTILEP